MWWVKDFANPFLKDSSDDHCFSEGAFAPSRVFVRRCEFFCFLGGCYG